MFSDEQLVFVSTSHQPLDMDEEEINIDLLHAPMEDDKIYTLETITPHFI